MSVCDFKALFQAYSMAARNKDAAAMLALYDDEVLAFDMWGAWSLDGIEAVRAMVQNWFGGLGEETVGVSFELVKAQYGADLASACAIVSFSAASPQGAVLRSMQNRLTWVAARRGDGWKIIHQHISSPIDPKTVSVIFSRADDTA